MAIRGPKDCLIINIFRHIFFWIVWLEINKQLRENEKRLADPAPLPPRPALLLFSLHPLATSLSFIVCAHI